MFMDFRASTARFSAPRLSRLEETAERARERFESRAEAKRQSIEQQLSKATGLRAGALLSRQQRAAQHFEKAPRLVGRDVLKEWSR